MTNLDDAMRYVPGVWTASDCGSDELFFSSRGSNLDATDYDKNGIELFQDGLPVTTADGNDHNRVAHHCRCTSVCGMRFNDSPKKPHK